MIRNKICALLIIMGLLAPVGFPVSAGAVSAIDCSGKLAQTDVCKESNKGGNPIIKALKVVIEILAIIIGFAAVVMIIIGGIRLSTSQGDPSSIKSARDTIIYALVGIVVAIFAQVIVSFVLTKL